jgi:hypothetical protein
MKRNAYRVLMWKPEGKRPLEEQHIGGGVSQGTERKPAINSIIMY